MLSVNNLVGFGAGGGPVETGIIPVGSPTSSGPSAGSITLPSGLREDDIVIVVSGSDNAIDTNDKPTGYTLIAEAQYFSADHVSSYKFMGSTPDTTATGLTNDASTHHICMAFRNVDTTTPIDATPTTDGANGTNPDPPSYTTVTANALRIIIGWLDDDNVTQSHAWDADGNPTIYTGVTVVGSLGMTMRYAPSTGADNPAAFSGGSDKWTATHFALRPANP